MHTARPPGRPPTEEAEMADLETCSKCGAAVADSYRHRHWHERTDDELSSLKRVVRDLETSTKRSLQQFETTVRLRNSDT